MSWQKIWSRCRDFWTQDHSLSVLLALLILLLFVVTPLVSGATIRSEIGTAFFSMVAITGVAAVARKPGAIAVASFGAALSVALDWLAHFSTSPEIQLIDMGLRIVFVVLLGWLVLAQVFRAGDPTHHRVQGAIVVYLLAGLAWGYGYEVIAMLNPAAFHLPPRLTAASAFARPGLFRYFSFETLTTLGYGDILPLSPVARSFAAFEALFGQLYPAAMIARVISLELRPRRLLRSLPRRRRVRARLAKSHRSLTVEPPSV